MSRRDRALLVLTAVLSLSAGGCREAGDVDLLEIDATGVLFGQLVLDANGTGEADAGDDPLADAEVQLSATRGSQVIQTDVTDSVGAFRFDDLPVGTYSLGVAEAVLGDSLEVVSDAGASGGVTLIVGDNPRVDFLVSHPFAELEEVGDMEVGRLVFTSGIALNARQPFGDGLVHLRGRDGFLRLLNVERANLSAGDSIRVRGRTVIDNGRPALDEVQPFVLVSSAIIPLPRDLSTAEAATAQGGDADASLVRVRDAEIHDTMTVNDDFHFNVDDGSGPVRVVLRSFLQLPTNLIRPDTIVRIGGVTGLLTPFEDGAGVVTWRVLPRAGSDVTVEIKTADISVQQTVDPAQASMGDTVTFVVTVENLGPLTATSVEVFDSIAPDLLTILQSESSQGEYDESTGIWNVGMMEVGATASLTISVEVVTTLVGTLVQTARSNGLEKEVDPNPANDASSVSLTLAPPAPAISDGGRNPI